MSKEYFDIVDEQGRPTGQIVERKTAHANGIPHRTAHVWLLRKRDGVTEVLLQKRCETKDSFPGCYDISSAGHIPAGVDYIPSALRELQEELGVAANESDLIPCGDRLAEWNGSFHGAPFHDKEYTRVFCLWCDKDEQDFRLQPEEVSAVRWMEYKTLLKAVQENTIHHCIYAEELQMVEAKAII